MKRRIQTINTEVLVDVKKVFEGDENFIVVSLLLDESYTQDRCSSCAWAAWPTSADLTEGVQRWGPLTTIGAYRYEDRLEAVSDVQNFMSRQGYTITDPGDYDDEEDMLDSIEYDSHYTEAIQTLESSLMRRPADQFTIWDGLSEDLGRAPRFAIHVTLIRFGGV